MGVDYENLVQTALCCKADYAAVARAEDIHYEESFRKACEQNVCRKYNANWVCPPAVGPISELKERASQFPQGLLFQTVYTLSSSFDLKGMQAAKKVHDGVFRDILAAVRQTPQVGEVLPLNAGACGFCERCAYLDQEPCRFPQEAFASVEAYGIDVIRLEKACGIPYYHGKNTIGYVGLILFHEQK